MHMHRVDQYVSITHLALAWQICRIISVSSATRSSRSRGGSKQSSRIGERVPRRVCKGRKIASRKVEKLNGNSKAVRATHKQE